MSALFIRSYQNSDRDACIAVFKSNIPKFFLKTEQKDFESYLKEGLSDYWVVVHSQAGIIACGGLAPESEDEVRLCYGLVHSQFHRRGIGKALLLFRLVQACNNPNLKYVSLDTIQFNPNFFGKAGFVTEKVSENHYGPNLHRYDMRLQIDHNSKLNIEKEFKELIGKGFLRFEI